MDRRIEINLANARAVADLQYRELLCPRCGSCSAQAFFSVDESQGRYGIWFECDHCGNVEHISCGRMPSGFSPDRVSEKFQQLDQRAWSAENGGRPEV